MDFLKNNKKLVALGIAILLAIAGAYFKVDVPALLKSVTDISKQVETLDAPAPAPAPTAPAQ